MLITSSFAHKLRRLARERDGVSAVEFALILPLMLSFYLGAVEVSQGVSIDRKVTLTTRTVADLASQVASINNSDMSNLLGASTSVMTPYPVTPLKIVVSAVNIDNDGIAKVAWSDTLNGTKRTVDSVVTLPPALVVNNTQLIWSEVTYTYTPTIGYVITGSINLNDQIFMRPRLSDKVTRINS